MRDREEIFDGQQIVTLRDDFLKEIEIPVEGIPVEPNRQTAAQPSTEVSDAF